MSTPTMALEQDRRISEVVGREEPRLWNFIRRRVPDLSDAEDVLQDVFTELVEANRLLMPIEHITGWLYRVARNRITDLFRGKKTVSLSEPVSLADGEHRLLEDLLPSADDGPAAAYARSVLVEELASALEELPAEQRAVFVAHEIDGRTFRQMADETGMNINTLLARKRYAVLALRERLEEMYEEFSERGGV